MLSYGGSLGNYAAPDTPRSTLSLTTTAAVPAGGLVVLGFSQYFEGTTTVSDDGAGLTWVQGSRVVKNGESNMVASIWYAHAPSGLASGTTITITFGTTAYAPNVCAIYLTGAATSSVVDVYASGNQTANNGLYSVPLTTTNADDAIVAFGWVDHLVSSLTPGGGFTEVHDFSNSSDSNSCGMLYRIVSSTGTYTASHDTTSGSASHPGIGAAIAFKAAPGGGVTDNVSLSAISSGEAFSAVGLKDQMTLTGIATAENVPTLKLQDRISLAGIASAENVPAVFQSGMRLQGIASGEVVPAVTLSTPGAGPPSDGQLATRGYGT